MAVAFEAKGGLGDLKSTATAAVVKALLGSSSREVLPYNRKALDGPLTSVTPLVQVRSLAPLAHIGAALRLVLLF